MSVLIDSYSVNNYMTGASMYDGFTSEFQGQSFSVTADTILDSVKLHIIKSGSPTGNISATIYAHTGTYGISSVPTGSPLATSDVIDVTTFGTVAPLSFEALPTFTFSGVNKITLTAGTKYCVVINYSAGNSTNKLLVGFDITGTASGNRSISSNGSSWTANSSYDLVFYVYGDNPITLKINGTDIATQVDWQSVTKTEVLTKEPDSLEFLIRNYGTKTYRPVLGDDVTLYNNATKIFGGVVISTKDEIDGLLKYFSVTCKDYTQVLDRLLVSANYTSKTVDYIIDDIISRFTTGFTVVNVNCPITIDTVSFNYVSVSQCLLKLTQLCGGGFDWYVDYDKDVHFFATAGVAAPFSLTDTSANFDFGTLTLQQDTSQLRNFITVRGGEEQGTAIENQQVADGKQRIFFVGYRLSSFLAYKALAVSPTTFVALTVGDDGKDDPASYNCLYNADKGLLIFPDASKPASGDVIKYTGIPNFPIIVQVQNSTSISTYGQYQSVIVDKTITSKDAAIKRANAELLNYGLPITTGSFTTNTSGLKTGQTLSINSTIRGIVGSYKIQKITTTLKTPSATTGEFRYQVDFLSTIDVSLVDVLNKLLVTDPANNITIGTNEIIQIIYSFDESFTFTDSVGTPTTSSPPYVYGTAKYNLSTWG